MTRRKTKLFQNVLLTEKEGKMKSYVASKKSAEVSLFWLWLGKYGSLKYEIYIFPLLAINPIIYMLIFFIFKIELTFLTTACHVSWESNAP